MAIEGQSFVFLLTEAEREAIQEVLVRAVSRVPGDETGEADFSARISGTLLVYTDPPGVCEIIRF